MTEMEHPEMRRGSSKKDEKRLEEDWRRLEEDSRRQTKTRGLERRGTRELERGKRQLVGRILGENSPMN